MRDQSHALALKRPSKPLGDVSAIHSAAPSDERDFGPSIQKENMFQIRCSRHKDIPRSSGMAQQSAQVKNLDARHCQRDENCLDIGTAIANQPQKLLAIEGLLAKAYFSFSSNSRTRISAAKLPLRPRCAPHILNQIAPATVMLRRPSRQAFPIEMRKSRLLVLREIGVAMARAVQRADQGLPSTPSLGFTTSPTKNSIMDA